MSERLTWESCPECRRLAAVGWLDGRPVHIDCPNGCRLTPSPIATTFRSWPLTAVPSGAPLDRGGAVPR